MAANFVAQQRPRGNAFLRRDYWLISVVVSSVGAAFCTFLGYWTIPSFLAIFLTLLCLYPSIRYGIEEGELVPAVPILSGAFALQFSLPVFFGDDTVSLVGGIKDIDEPSLTAALVLATVAFSSFLWVSYSKFSARIVNKLPAFSIYLNRTRALFFCLFFGLLGLLVTRLTADITVDVQYSAIVRVVQNQMLVAIGVLGWLTYTSRSIELRLIYYFLVSAAVVDGLSTGFLEAALIPIGIMFAGQWIFLHRVNKWLVALLLGTMLLLNPVKSDYREATWFSAGPEQSKIDKALLWTGKGLEYWRQALLGDAEGGSSAITQLARRTSMIDILAHVMETTPDGVPYLHGETYAFIAYSLVPRFLWPEKPTATANRTLAVQYGLTTEEGAEKTTFGISLVGEGYANFGVAGAVLVMSLLAFVLLVLQRIFTTTASGPGGYALFMALFIFFLNGLGSSAEILFGNLLQSALASFILIYGVTDRRRVQAG